MDLNIRRYFDRGNNHRQFSLKTCTTDIGQFVHLVGWKVIGYGGIVILDSYKFNFIIGFDKSIFTLLTF